MRKPHRKPRTIRAKSPTLHVSHRLQRQTAERIATEAKKLKVSKSRHIQELIGLAYVTIEGKQTLAHRLQTELKQRIAKAMARRAPKTGPLKILSPAC